MIVRPYILPGIQKGNDRPMGGAVFQISIDGPAGPLDRLSQAIEERFHEPLQRYGGHKGDRLFMTVVEKRLDERLRVLSGLAAAVERKEGLGEEAFTFNVRDINQSEPLSGSKDFVEPFVPVPGFTVRPWSSNTPNQTLSKDDDSIILDPETSFGTGKHPTTRLCLQLLLNVYAGLGEAPRNGGIQRVLDIGCGSGILSIAAAKMGARDVLGVDIDPASVEAARRNVRLNRLESRIRIDEGSIEAASGVYDLVIANLVASVLFSMLPKVGMYLSSDGLAIVSGLRGSQDDTIAGLVLDAGMHVVDSASSDGWKAFLVRMQ